MSKTDKIQGETRRRVHHSNRQNTNDEALAKLRELYLDVFDHEGYGDLRVLRRRQKEVVLHCGKQFRYVIDVDSRGDRDEGQSP
ncbi:MAG: hypothetical protein ACI9DC_003879 [Gammaproteobacteria bacterium]|jgi:hypothetical protein